MFEMNMVQPHFKNKFDTLKNRIMNQYFWKASLLSGIIAAFAMLILEMILNPLFLGASAWGTPRMMTAILLGQEVLQPPANFSFGIILASLAVHIPLSLIYVIIIGTLARNLLLFLAITGGAVIGFIIYVVNFSWFTSWFPWFAEARNWIQIVIHILFGAIVGWLFKELYKKPAVPQSKAAKAY